MIKCYSCDGVVDAVRVAGLDAINYEGFCEHEGCVCEQCKNRKNARVADLKASERDLKITQDVIDAIANIEPVDGIDIKCISGVRSKVGNYKTGEKYTAVVLATSLGDIEVSVCGGKASWPYLGLLCEFRGVIYDTPGEAQRAKAKWDRKNG